MYSAVEVALRNLAALSRGKRDYLSVAGFGCGTAVLLHMRILRLRSEAILVARLYIVKSSK